MKKIIIFLLSSLVLIVILSFKLKNFYIPYDRGLYYGGSCPINATNCVSIDGGIQSFGAQKVTFIEYLKWKKESKKLIVY